MKILSCTAAGLVALIMCSCSINDGNKSSVEKAKLRSTAEKKLFHSGMKPANAEATGELPPSPVLIELKKNHLAVNQAKTIGEAFDSYKYATKIEWRETAKETTEFPYYIDYICWLPVKTFSSVALKENVVKRALDIKFAILENGETYVAMASRTEIKSDGMIHSTPLVPSNTENIIKAIYENREISF